MMRDVWELSEVELRLRVRCDLARLGNACVPHQDTV